MAKTFLTYWNTLFSGFVISRVCILSRLILKRKVSYALVFFVEKTVKDVEGIFRVSGMMKEVQEFKARADQGVENLFPPTADPHCVAGVLKLWIREMPEPLLSYALYDQFLQTKCE